MHGDAEAARPAGTLTDDGGSSRLKRPSASEEPMTAPAIRLIPRLCRAARALLGWQQQDVAEASDVPKPTLSAFEIKEEGSRLATMNNRAVVEAFEKAGLEFIPENGGGVGLRLKKRTPNE
jgi:DNA-binding XRE family transcriptional regulator